MKTSNQRTMKRLDAGESIFFARELEAQLGQFDIKYPELKATALVPSGSFSVDPGDEIFTWQQYDRKGVAQVVSAYADDFPRVDVTGKEFSGKVKSIGASYGYSVQDIRAARRANKPLDAMKARACQKAIATKLDKMLQTGYSPNGMKGFLNVASAQTYVIPADGSGASPLWSTKTSDQVVRDMFGIANAAVVATFELEIPDNMVLPLSRFQYVSQTRMSTNSDTTILDYFLAHSPYVKQVSSWTILETAGSGNGTRAVVYRRDPDAIRAIIPVVFEQMPPELKNMDYSIACHARTGGVVSPYPMSVSYADGM